MSDPAAIPAVSSDDAALAVLVELDLELARKAHAMAMAATDADELNGLARTYQRLSRCVRQTILLKNKVRLDREKAAREAGPPAPVKPTFQAIRTRFNEVGAAVRRVIHERVEDMEMVDWLEEALDDDLAAASLRDDFLAEDLETHIARLIDFLGLNDAEALYGYDEDDDLGDLEETPPLQDSA